MAEETDQITNLLMIAPLVILVIVATVLVIRGLPRKPDGTVNKGDNSVQSLVDD